MDKQKAKCLDFILGIISFAIIFTSYIITINFMAKSQENLNSINNAFIFISPCALEATNIFLTKVSQRNLTDLFEMILCLVSIVATIFCFILMLLQCVNNCLIFILQISIIVYPLKFAIITIDSFLDLIKWRN